MVLVIGAGGIGCWLIRLLDKLTKDGIAVYDGDTIERHNLDRQLFTERFIGSNKAEATVKLMRSDKIAPFPVFITQGTDFTEVKPSYMFCCVDNHTAREACLYHADDLKVPLIIAANEYVDAEAYIYRPEWEGTALDPRIYYPDILTDKSGDPLSPCTGEIQEAHPQLALANYEAAGFAAKLYWADMYHREKLMEFMPYRLISSLAKFRTDTEGDVENGEKD